MEVIFKFIRRHIVVYSVLVCMLGVVVFFLLSDSRVVVVSGNSMEPTYVDGDRAVTTPVSTPANLPLNYPVCWVTLPDGNDVIKRLVGYPGDEVELRDGATYVNGVCIMEAPPGDFSNKFFEVPPAGYLFLGDNRANSIDARYWDIPYLTLSNISGFIENSGLEPLRGD